MKKTTKQINFLTDLEYDSLPNSKNLVYKYILKNEISFTDVEEIKGLIKLENGNTLEFKDDDVTAFIRNSVVLLNTDKSYETLFGLLPKSLYHKYLSKESVILPKKMVKEFITKGLETCPDKDLWVSLYHMKGFSKAELTTLNKKAEKLNKEIKFRVFSKEEWKLATSSDLNLTIFKDNVVDTYYVHSDFKRYFNNMFTHFVKTNNKDLTYLEFTSWGSYYMDSIHAQNRNKNFVSNSFALLLAYNPEKMYNLVFNFEDRSLFDSKVNKELATLILFKLNKKLVNNEPLKEYFTRNNLKTLVLTMYSIINQLQTTFKKKDLKQFQQEINTYSVNYSQQLKVELFNFLMDNWKDITPEKLEKIVLN